MAPPASSARSAPSCRCSRTPLSRASSLVAGANEPDAHLRGVRPGRDFEFEEVDVRTVEAGDLTPGGQPVEIVPAIEIGNIFKLGTRYSEPLGATYLDEGGRERSIVMGCYGIGPARIVAAAIEQRADERGHRLVARPGALAAPPRLAGEGRGDEQAAADRIYEELLSRGIDVLYDDREAGPGEKLTDAELLGCPLRLVVGRRALAEGQVEAQLRRSGEDRRLSAEGAAVEAISLLEEIDE